MMNPESDSISESKPKPTSAIEPAAIPAPTAIRNSTRCQAFPPHASSFARRTSRARSSGASRGKAAIRRRSPRASAGASWISPPCSGSATSLLVRDVLQADIEQKPDVGILERVVDVAPLLPITDEPARPQQAHVVADRRL